LQRTDYIAFPAKNTDFKLSLKSQSSAYTLLTFFQRLFYLFLAFWVFTWMHFDYLNKRQFK